MKRIVREINPDWHGYYDDNLKFTFTRNNLITFEQAFAERELKPVVFIKDNNIMWLYHNPANGMVVVNHNSPWYAPFNTMELCKIEQCDAAYQAESWNDLHLNVIPALIRMARGGV